MVSKSRQFRHFDPTRFTTQEFCDEKQVWSTRYRRQFAARMRIAYIAKHGKRPPTERYRYQIRYIYSDINIANQILKEIIERTKK